MLYKEYVKEKESKEIFNEVSSLIDEEDEELSAYDTYIDVYEKNNDFVAWIKIEDTNINYPVMQTIDEPNYYLRRGFDKSYNPYGVPYVQEDCDIVSSNNLIIEFISFELYDNSCFKFSASKFLELKILVVVGLYEIFKHLEFEGDKGGNL